MQPDRYKPVILITRPQPDADEFAKACIDLGYNVCIEPMLTIKELQPEIDHPERYDAVIFTSVQAVRLMPPVINPHDLIAYCVGEKTAGYARKLGFKAVHVGAGSAQDLIDLIVEGDAGLKYLHLRGVDAAVEVAQSLQDQNISCDEVRIYKAEAVEGLGAISKGMIVQGQVAVLPFFSKRTAETFLRHVERLGLASSLASIKVLCISSSVLECVQTYRWDAAHVAAKPTQESVLDALSGLLANELMQVERENMSSKSEKAQAIENASEIIERFGGIRPMAKKVEVAVTTIQGWKKRDRIPANRRAQIIEAAQEHDVDLSGILDMDGVANQNDQKPEKPPSKKNDEKPPEKKERSAKPNAPVIENLADYEVQKAQHVEITEPLEQKIAEAQNKAVTRSVWINVTLMVIALAAVVALVWPRPSEPPQMDDERLSALEQDLGQIQGRVEEVQQQQSFFGALIPDDLDQQLADLREQADQAQAQIGQAIEQAQAVSQDVLAENAGSLEERIAQLETHMSEMVGTPQMDALLSRFNVLQENAVGQSMLDQTMGDIAVALENASAYQAQLADASAEEDQAQSVEPGFIDQSVNAALDGVRQQSIAMNQTFADVPATDLKAAAMLLAMSQFRSSLNRDRDAFDTDLGILMKLVGNDDQALVESLSRLAPYSEQGVLTPGGLSTEFKTIAGDAVVASLQGEDVSFTERMQARFSDLFQIEKNGELIGATPTQANIKSAENLLQDGDVAGAIIKLEQLDGPAAQVVAPWLDQARATVMAQEAQGMLSELIQAGGVENMVGNVVPEGALIRDEETGINILRPAGALPMSSVPTQD